MNDKLCGAKQECVVLDSILEFCPVRYKVLRVSRVTACLAVSEAALFKFLFVAIKCISDRFAVGVAVVNRLCLGVCDHWTGLLDWTTRLDYWTLISMH